MFANSLRRKGLRLFPRVLFFTPMDGPQLPKGFCCKESDSFMSDVAFVICIHLSAESKTNIVICMSLSLFEASDDKVASDFNTASDNKTSGYKTTSNDKTTSDDKSIVRPAS